MTKTKPRDPALPSPDLSLLPTKGRFLVASNKLQDPWFKKTVVLLIEHSPAGSMGLIINRPTTIKLADLLKDISTFKKRQDVAFFGGPVEGNRIFLLIRSLNKVAEASRITENIHMSTSKITLERLGTGELNLSFRAYAGYAGWSAGQLDAEIAQGGWFVTRADARIIFEGDAKTIWRDMIRDTTTMQVRRGN